MDRRKTLAGLSPGQVNSRASLAPGRIAKDMKNGGGWNGAGKGPLDKAMSRMSLAGPVQRRSSAYTTIKSAPGLKSDPRPVGDKAFQQNCIRTVIAYLAAHGYEFQVTPKVLSSPTTKDFTNMMTFLMRQVDANLIKNLGRLEEEVPQLYKRLKYPFQISKSNLTAVGSPHTWPTILAAVTWLVELLSYAERADGTRQALADDRAKAEAEFFDYVATSYKFFLAGEDDKCEEVDAEKALEFERRAVDIQSDAERLTLANESLRKELERLRSEPSPLVAANVKLTETTEDHDKFVKLLDNLNAHKASLQRKVAERQADVAAQQAELDRSEAEIVQLKERVATQPVQPTDVIRMNQDRSKQEAALRTLSTQREAADTRVSEQEAEVETRLDTMEATLQEYHTQADRLQFIPATAKRAEGVGFEIRLERGATTAGEMVGVDLKGIIKPALQRVRENYASRARDLAAEELSLQEKKDSMHELLSERSEENSNAEITVQKLEAKYKASREALEGQINATASQVEGVAAEVNGLRGVCKSSVSATEERYRVLQAESEELAKACEAENALLHRELSSALEAILNHKLAVQAGLGAAGDAVQAVFEEVQQMPLPMVSVM